MAKITKEEALRYHAEGKPGKIEVVPTKPYSTQMDLSLAYSPGVAEPCLEIEKNPLDAYKYTSKGNLVAVISNDLPVLMQFTSRSVGWQAGDGRKRTVVQDLCRYRRIRYRSERERP